MVHFLDTVLYSFSKITFFVNPKARSLLNTKRLELGKQRIRDALKTYMKKNGLTSISADSVQMESLAAYVHDNIGSLRCFTDEVIFYNTFREEVTLFINNQNN